MLGDGRWGLDRFLGRRGRTKRREEGEGKATTTRWEESKRVNNRLPSSTSLATVKTMKDTLTSRRDSGATGANNFPPRLSSDPPPIVLTVFHWLGNGALVFTPEEVFPAANVDGDPFEEEGRAGGPINPPKALTVVGPGAADREGRSMLTEISFPNARRLDPKAEGTAFFCSADSERTREKEGRGGGGEGRRMVLIEDEEEEALKGGGGGGGGREGASK